MSVVQVPTLLVLAPLFVLGAIVGVKRGWRAELWTLGLLVAVWLFAARADMALIPLLERVIGAVQRAGQVLFGRDSGGPAFRFGVYQRPWVALVATVALVAGAYAGGARAARGELGRGLARFLGPLLGVANVMLVAFTLMRRLTAIRGAQDRVSMLVPPFPGATVVVNVPTNPASLLAQWPFLLVLLAAAVGIVLLLARSGRIGGR